LAKLHRCILWAELISGADGGVGAVVVDFNEHDVEGLVPIPGVHRGGLERVGGADVGQDGSVAGDLVRGGDAAEDADEVKGGSRCVIIGDAGDADLTGGAAAVCESLLIDAGETILAVVGGVLRDAVVLVELVGLRIAPAIGTGVAVDRQRIGGMAPART
jgi:hypothetical protein